MTWLRRGPTGQAAWGVFGEHYGRYTYRWCRQWRFQDADAEDETPDILLKLARKLRAFPYDRMALAQAAARLRTVLAAAETLEGYGQRPGMDPLS